MIPQSHVVDIRKLVNLLDSTSGSHVQSERDRGSLSRTIHTAAFSSAGQHRQHVVPVGVHLHHIPDGLSTNQFWTLSLPVFEKIVRVSASGFA